MPDKALNLLIRRLEAITSISEDEKKAILNLPVRLTDLRADADVFREGDRPSQCCLLVEGFLTRYKDLSNGKRQIMAFYVPGDIPDLLSLHIDVMDHSLATDATGHHSSVAATIREGLGSQGGRRTAQVSRAGLSKSSATVIPADADLARIFCIEIPECGFASGK
jgi:CRP-like cAMP-binding protein